MQRVGKPGLGEAWCRLMHRDVMWPVNGHYQCRQCLREFRVPWEDVAPRRHPGRPAEITARAEVMAA